MKDYSIMTDSKNRFDQFLKKLIVEFMQTKNLSKRWLHIRFLLDYTNFKENCKLIATDLSKQQSLGADLKTIKQTNFTGNPNLTGNAIFFFILEEVKETILEVKKNIL